MSVETQREIGEARIEEIQFLRSFGWNDKQVARRLGMSWGYFHTFVKRHPELLPIRDPEQRERDEVSAFNLAVFGRR